MADWVFQFDGGLAKPHFERHFSSLVEQLKIAKDRDDFGRIITYYDELLSDAHQRRCFEVCKSYLNTFTEFWKVHHLVSGNIPIVEGHVATSTSFDATPIMYGNLFEVLGDNVEVLVALNNPVQSRSFDQLCNITVAAYRIAMTLGVFQAIAENVDMAAVCSEFDNQIRNASHHGSISSIAPRGRYHIDPAKGGKAKSERWGMRVTSLASRGFLFTSCSCCAEEFCWWIGSGRDYPSSGCATMHRTSEAMPRCGSLYP